MRRFAVAAALVTPILVASPALAGNGETFYLGDDAALLAGAATANTEGASALWYNPARIPEGGSDSIELSVSAYTLHLGGTPDFRGDGNTPVTQQKSSGLSIGATPTTVAYKHTLFGWDIGYGIFTSNTALSATRSLLQTTPAGAAPTRLAVDGNDQLTEYYGGIGVGRVIAPNLALGITVFGYYASESDTSAVGVTFGDGSYSIHAGSANEHRLGLQVVSGLAYRPHPWVRVGLVLRSPVFEILSGGQNSDFEAQGDATSGTASVQLHDSALQKRSAILAPARAALGVAIDTGKDTTVAIDLKVRAPYSNGEARVADAAADVRAGLRTRVGAQTWIGGGLFTDRSTVPKSDAGSTALDYYGATLGLEFGKPYRVLSEDDKRETLRFATAIALSYSLGVGTVGNVAVSDRAGEVAANTTRDRAVAHEFILMLGSTLSTRAGR